MTEPVDISTTILLEKGKSTTITLPEGPPTISALAADTFIAVNSARIPSTYAPLPYIDGNSSRAKSLGYSWPEIGTMNWSWEGVEKEVSRMLTEIAALRGKVVMLESCRAQLEIYQNAEVDRLLKGAQADLYATQRAADLRAKEVREQKMRQDNEKLGNRMDVFLEMVRLTEEMDGYRADTTTMKPFGRKIDEEPAKEPAKDDPLARALSVDVWDRIKQRHKP